MKSFIPGQISQLDIRTLKALRSEFLDEITEQPEETEYRARMHAEWVQSTFKRPGGVIGTRDTEYTGPTESKGLSA